jgi:hypothetical protein
MGTFGCSITVFITEAETWTSENPASLKIEALLGFMPPPGIITMSPLAWAFRVFNNSTPCTAEAHCPEVKTRFALISISCLKAVAASGFKGCCGGLGR